MKATITSFAILFTFLSNTCFTANEPFSTAASRYWNSKQLQNLPDCISATPLNLQIQNLHNGVAGTPYSKSDSLPDGVTKDWLSKLRDENGNKIMQGEYETDFIQRRIFDGFSPNEYFGVKVSMSGDVNGDGFNDIAIGATYNNAGRLYLYFGGPNMDTEPEVILTGEADSSEFGNFVTLTNVNGDSYCDVIVGANHYNSSTGRVYVFLGGVPMDTIADVVMTGEDTGDLFGILGAAGDFNKDGYDDIIVGADGYSSNTGRAYIYFGGAAMNNVPDVIMNGQGSNHHFGTGVSSAGDVNGDGFEDVIVGASGAWRAYIFFGGTNMNNAEDVVMNEGAGEGGFGQVVSSAGDVNGDGFSDVIVGADRYGNSDGRAYIYYGGSAMNDTADVIMTGEGPVDYFGTALSSAGDINKDGYSDVIVVAYMNGIGRVYVYFGSSTMNNTADIIINNVTFANVVTGGSDVSGDGNPDFLVGAFRYNSNTGRVYLYDYNVIGNITSDTLGTIIPDLVMTGEGTSNYLGAAVSSAGDVNNDGYSDVVVGAPGYNSNTGRAYIFFGGVLMNNTADVTMTGESANNNFGYAVSSAGDVNKDGYSDVIIGAGWYGPGLGRAYIYFGGAVMNSIADVTMEGELSSSHFGVEVSTAGDVNGDTYSDVIVGAYRYGPSAGRTYIYFGGAAMDSVADLKMTGEETQALFGMAASTAGDVNGDGYSDVIVGAAHDFAPADTGKVYIFYGGASMDTIADVTMYGEATADDFGADVSSAGDLNGDGFSDVIVGAITYSGNTGNVYIFFGGTTMNNTADVILNVETISNNHLAWVSSAGDVNGDSYSDVIVGVKYYSTYTGRAKIFFGGAVMDTIADVTMNGEAINNDFGEPVSSAGDVNGDGFSDVIVGAPKYNSNTGRAYIYLASAIGSPVNKSFRSKASGNWDSPLTWEMSTDGGSSWVPATSYPDNSSDSITIQSSHIVTLTSNDSASQIVINNGATLNILSKTLKLSHPGIPITNNGTFITANGTIEYNGSSPQTLVTTNVNYANLKINNPAGVTVSSNFSIPGLLSIVNGNLNLNGKTITLLDTARLLETPGNTVSGYSGSITTTRIINHPSSLNIGGLGAVITSSQNFDSTTITRMHNIENVSLGKPSIKRNFTITPKNNSALDASLIFKYDTSELDTLNESSLALYSDTTGGVNYTFEGGIVDTANNQIALSYVHSFSRWTASRGSNIVNYDSTLTGNLYAKGKLCIRWGSFDTIRVRINRPEIPNNDSVKLNYVIKEQWEPFDIIFDMTLTIPHFLQSDTLISLGMPFIGNIGPHSVIVQAIPDELVPLNGYDIQTYCFDVTCDAFSYIEPCDTIDGGAGFDGGKGRMAAGFKNLNAIEDFPIHAIDQSFLDSSVGNVPYKLAIYADNGSGKPGTALYVSPEMLTPEGNGTVKTVTHEVNPPVNIPPNTRFYVGYIQTSTANIRASFQDEIPVRSNVFFFSNSDSNNVWMDFAADSSKNFRLDISPRTSTGDGTICGFTYTLNLTSIIEGFYDASSDIMVSDTAKAYLRNAVSPYAKVDSNKAVLNSSGIGIFSFSNVIYGTNYYIVVTHRNSIETWSKTTQAFAGGSLTYNFTTAASQAFGDNMKQVDASPIRFAIYGGDVNQDGIVDGTDASMIDNDASNFLSEYLPTDLTGDKFIDGSDGVIADNNAANFVSAVIP